MPSFKVLCFVGGKWDENEAVKIEATHALEAAEKVCGEPLIEGVKLGDIRATVRPLDNPNDVTTFRKREI